MKFPLLFLTSYNIHNPATADDPKWEKNCSLQAHEHTHTHLTLLSDPLDKQINIPIHSFLLMRFTFE